MFRGVRLPRGDIGFAGKGLALVLDPLGPPGDSRADLRGIRWPNVARSARRSPGRCSVPSPVGASPVPAAWRRLLHGRPGMNARRRRRRRPPEPRVPGGRRGSHHPVAARRRQVRAAALRAGQQPNPERRRPLLAAARPEARRRPPGPCRGAHRTGSCGPPPPAEPGPLERACAPKVLWQQLVRANALGNCASPIRAIQIQLTVMS